MDIDKINKAVNEEFEDVLDVCFGNWIHGIFGGYEKLHIFEEEKEAFFILLKKLVDENKIVIFPPEKYYINNESYSVPTMQQRDPDTVRPYVYWNESSDIILKYMRSVFPSNVTDENDEELNDFWYGNDCVRIGWVDSDTGHITAS